MCIYKEKPSQDDLLKFTSDLSQLKLLPGFSYIHLCIRSPAALLTPTKLKA